MKNKNNHHEKRSKNFHHKKFWSAQEVSDFILHMDISLGSFDDLLSRCTYCSKKKRLKYLSNSHHVTTSNFLVMIARNMVKSYKKHSEVLYQVINSLKLGKIEKRENSNF